MKMLRRRLLQIILLWLMGGFTARAEPIVWQGTAGTDWFDAANWDLSRVPGDTDAVVIDGAAAVSGHVVLSNATASLASCIITNATLVFTNWTTCLQAATVEVRDQGLLTLPPAFPVGAMSNRVHIVCTNFVLAAGGSIDASGKGYASDNGPGRGIGSSNRAGGGGHGGHGGMGGHYGAYGGIGGAGGGAVRIEATSQVTVDGVVLADGQDSPYRGGGGSGGSILINCATFGGGAGGLLSAKGGSQDHISGSGGGGRIAVHYTELGGKPGVRFSTGPGGAEVFDPLTRWFQSAYPGTVFLSDLGMLDETIDAEQFQGVRLFNDGATSWTVDSLAVSNASLRLADDGFQLTVRGDLTIGKDGTLGIGADNGQGMTRLVCGGSLILTNGGALSIHAGATNGVTDHGALVSVTNAIRIYAGSWVYPHSHNANGGSVLFRARSVAIGADSGFFATARGFLYGKGPGKGAQAGIRGGGGGYGGVGGRGATTGALGGKAYGDAASPLDPGSGSGIYYSFGGPGGGLVRVEAAGSVVNDGQIIADGGIVHTHSGGGSGGGVHIRSAAIEGYGLIRADGGNGSTLSGGGGGGRIAIITGRDRFTGEQPGTYIAYAGSADNRISVLGAAVGYLPGTNGTFHIWRPTGTVLLIR